MSTKEHRIGEIVAEHHRREGPLLPILHEVQAEFGCVDTESEALIAKGLNLSRADVHGVVSFYHDFRPHPPGRHVIRLCRAESCQATGAVALAEHVCRRLGADFGATTTDGEFTLEAVYCLGNCGCSPAMTLNDELYGRVTPELFDHLVAERKASRG